MANKFRFPQPHPGLKGGALVPGGSKKGAWAIATEFLAPTAPNAQGRQVLPAFAQDATATAPPTRYVNPGDSAFSAVSVLGHCDDFTGGNFTTLTVGTLQYIDSGCSIVSGRNGTNAIQTGGVGFYASPVPAIPTGSISGDMSMEMWAKLSSAGLATYCTLFMVSQSGSGDWSLLVDAAKKPTITRYYDGGLVEQVTGSVALPFDDGLFHHYALSKVGLNDYFYVDGVLWLTNATSHNAGDSTSGNPWYVGFLYGFAYTGMTGVMDDTRFRFGTSLFTGTSTAVYDTFFYDGVESPHGQPGVITQSATAINLVDRHASAGDPNYYYSTKFQSRFESVSGGTCDYDLGGSCTYWGLTAGGFTQGTGTGRAGTNAIDLSSGSYYNSGGGSSGLIQLVEASPLLAPYTTDFTYEVWLNFSTTLGYTEQLMVIGTNYSYNLLVGRSQTGYPTLSVTGDTTYYNLLTGGTFISNGWHHFALTRSGSLITLWVDGAVSISCSLSSPTEAFSTDRSGSTINYGLFYALGAHYAHYIVDSARITYTCRYTSAFTPADLSSAPSYPSPDFSVFTRTSADPAIQTIFPPRSAVQSVTLDAIGWWPYQNVFWNSGGTGDTINTTVGQVDVFTQSALAASNVDLALANATLPNTTFRNDTNGLPLFNTICTTRTAVQVKTFGVFTHLDDHAVNSAKVATTGIAWTWETGQIVVNDTTPQVPNVVTSWTVPECYRAGSLYIFDIFTRCAAGVTATAPDSVGINGGYSCTKVIDYQTESAPSRGNVSRWCIVFPSGASGTAALTPVWSSLAVQGSVVIGARLTGTALSNNGADAFLQNSFGGYYQSSGSYRAEVAYTQANSSYSVHSRTFLVDWEDTQNTTRSTYQGTWYAAGGTESVLQEGYAGYGAGGNLASGIGSITGDQYFGLDGGTIHILSYAYPTVAGIRSEIKSCIDVVLASVQSATFGGFSNAYMAVPGFSNTPMVSTATNILFVWAVQTLTLAKSEVGVTIPRAQDRYENTNHFPFANFKNVRPEVSLWAYQWIEQFTQQAFSSPTASFVSNKTFNTFFNHVRAYNDQVIPSWSVRYLDTSDLHTYNVDPPTFFMQRFKNSDFTAEWPAGKTRNTETDYTWGAPQLINFGKFKKSSLGVSGAPGTSVYRTDFTAGWDRYVSHEIYDLDFWFYLDDTEGNFWVSVFLDGGPIGFDEPIVDIQPSRSVPGKLLVRTMGVTEPYLSKAYLSPLGSTLDESAWYSVGGGFSPTSGIRSINSFNYGAWNHVQIQLEYRQEGAQLWINGQRDLTFYLKDSWFGLDGLGYPSQASAFYTYMAKVMVGTRVASGTGTAAVDELVVMAPAIYYSQYPTGDYPGSTGYSGEHAHMIPPEIFSRNRFLDSFPVPEYPHALTFEGQHIPLPTQVATATSAVANNAVQNITLPPFTQSADINTAGPTRYAVQSITLAVITQTATAHIVTPEVTFTLTQNWFNMGTTWMDDFLALVNAARANIGLPSIKPFAFDTVSLARYSIYDIAQQHSEDMVAALRYAHDDASFPVGWQTAAQRVALLADRGAENLWGESLAYLQASTVTYAWPSVATIFDGWWNSPPHKANMLMDWGSDNDSVYLDVGLAVGFLDPALGTSHDWWFIYYTSNYLVLKEVTVEIEFSQYWSNTGAVISLLDQSWLNTAYTRVVSSHEADYPLKLAVSNEADWGVTVQTSHEAPDYYGLQSSHEADYEPTTAIPQGAHIAGWDLHQIPVQQSNEAPWVLNLMTSHQGDYGDTPRARTSNEADYQSLIFVAGSNEALYASLSTVSASHEADYEPAPHVQTSNEAWYEPYGKPTTSHTALYEQLFKVNSTNEAVYQAMVTMATSNEAGYTGTVTIGTSHEAPIVTPTPVSTSNEQDWDLTVHNQVIGTNENHYTLVDDALAMGTNVVTLTHGTDTCRLDNGYISSGKSDTGYQFEAQINNLGMFTAINELDPIIVDFCGESYSLVVTSKSVNRSKVGSVSCTITAVSPIAFLDLPFAGGITYSPDVDKVAQDCVEEVLQDTVQWDIPAWTIPAYRLQMVNSSPLSVAKQIAQAAGGVLTSNPDGSIVVQYVYPYNWDKLDEQSPDQTYSDVQHNLSATSHFEYRSGYNLFRLRDSDSSFGDRLEWTVDAIDPFSGIVKVYPSPYRDSWTLRSTATTGILLDALGATTQQYTEVVEFKGGRASLGHPIVSLDGVTWKSESLGSVSYTAHGLELTAPSTVNLGYGLAEVTYTTVSYEFHITASQTVDVTQLIVQEN